VDATRLHEAAPASKLVILPNINHLLKEVGSSDGDANLATYGDPSLPLANNVVEAIAEFVSASKPRQPE